MKTPKNTKETKVKLVTKLSPPKPISKPTAKRGRPLKNSIISNQIIVSKSTPTNFMEKAREIANTKTGKVSKMLYVNGNSLRNTLKWLKPTETLNFLPGVQRALILKHIDRLANAIQLYGMLRPIIVVEIDFIDGYMRRYVADGQHTLMACMRLGISIPYVLVDGITNAQQLTELVSTLNSSSRSWKQSDYINAWSHSREDYKQLLLLRRKYNLDFDVVITASTGKDGGDAVKTLKAGKFEMTDFKKSELACRRVSNLLTLIPKMDRWSTRAVTRAAISIFTEETYTNVKHKALMAYVKNNADQLRFCASKKEIALEFLRQGF